VKPILDWIKTNWVIVTLTVVMVAVLPTAWFVSAKWNGGLRDRQQKLATADLTKLQGLQKVTYTLPPAVPGEKGLELATAPNDEVTKFFRERLKEHKAQTEAVVALAEKVNNTDALTGKERVTAVDGILPKARGDQADKVREFIHAIAILGDTKNPSVYETMLAAINAGGPPDAYTMAVELTDLRAREIEKLTATSGKTDLTLEERTAVRERLAARRQAEYLRRAQQISVYATPAIFPAQSTEFTISPFAPRTADLPNRPALAVVFAIQSDVWAVSDLLAAVKLANTGPDGRLTPVEQSVVKRIESITLDRNRLFELVQASQSGMGAEPAAAPAAAVTPGVVALDFRRSITGRFNSFNNQLYDVRNADMTVVVSSERLPQLFNAIRKTNMMEVIGCKLTEVDPEVDLADGYAYGPEHVVRAQLTIETVWLRSWTSKFMPDQYREILSVQTPAKSESEAAPAAPPPPGQG
jgi:hypothetical protein